MAVGGTAIAVALGNSHSCVILVSGVSTVEGIAGGDSGQSLQGFKDSEIQRSWDSGAGVVGIRQAGCGYCLGMGLGAGILDDRDFQVVELCADINDEAHGFVVGRVRGSIPSTPAPRVMRGRVCSGYSRG